ncbi:MAG: DUF2099 family protein [Candidatus Verstraetearchaeota archaeon]|nr:DUF2099 family protein [Candidatus Verstraetearchaeota archaeon]
MSQSDEHVLEAIGRSRVVVREGKIVEVGPSMIRECPLAKRFAVPVDKISPEMVRRNIEHRIRSFGMCTRERVLESSQDFVTFGASEMISQGLRSGIVGAAVIVCEGAGTLVTSNPDLVQGIGGRMSGLVSTSPIPALIERIESLGGIVLDRNGARVDQVEGTELAYREGFRDVAVTITDPQEGERIRALHPDALLFGVHLTGIGKMEAYRMAEVADLASGCASKWMREAAAERALLQAGTAIPVFAFTERGKRLVLEKVLSSSQRFLVKVEKIPCAGEKCPDPLV